MHDHLTNICGPHWFISFICTRPYDKNIWSSFICSFSCARPFDQKLVSSLIYFFYLHTTIRQKYIVLFHLFFLFARPFDQELGPSLIFFLFVHDHSTNVRSHSHSVIYYFLNCANILFAIFMAVLPLYFVYYVHWSAALIFHTLYSWLYIHYIHWSATLTFLTLCSCLYEVSSRSFGCWKSPLSLDIDLY